MQATKLLTSAACKGASSRCPPPSCPPTTLQPGSAWLFFFSIGSSGSVRYSHAPPPNTPSYGLPNSRFPHGPAHLGRTTVVMGVGEPGAWPVMDKWVPLTSTPLPPQPSSLEAPFRACRPAPTAELAASWDPMGGSGGRRADRPVQSPLLRRWRRVPGGRSSGTRGGEGAAREPAFCGCGPGLNLLPSAPRTLLHRVRRAGARLSEPCGPQEPLADAHLRASSPWLVESLFPPLTG